MKTPKTTRWKKHNYCYVPVATQVMELVIGIVVLTSGLNIWSALVSADPDILPPSVPTNFISTGTSASSIDLSWDASTDDVAVTGYKVFRNGALVASPAGTSLSDSGLTPNTGYSYTVSAFDAASNESPQTTAIVVYTLADTLPPSIPTNLRQTAQTTSTITIAWNASSDNVAVTGYDIYRNGSLVRSQSGTSYTDTGLAVYSGYNYSVTAHDGANNSSNLSATLVASTAQDTTPPSVPDNLRKTASTVSTITLAWDASSDDVGVSGYRLYRNGSLIGTLSGTSYTDTGLVVSTSYTYNVLAYDLANNQSAQSMSFSADSSNDVTPPTISANLRTSNVFDTSIALAWDASTDDVAVTGYKIYRNGQLVNTSATTSFTDTGLTPATTYSYTVQAYDAASNASANSATLAPQTAFDTTPPTVPSNLAMTDRTDTTIALSWDVSIDNDGVTGYDVYRDGNLITTTIGTSYTDSGLSVETSYTYRVRARDASGNNSAQSTPLMTSTLADEIPPSAPTALASPVQTTTTIDLTWSASTDDVAVVSYNIYRGGVLVNNVTDTDFTDGSRPYNTSYSYTVRAVDASDNESAASAAVVASTLPDTTAPIVTLTAPANGQGNVQFTIPISATATDDLALSRVEFYINSTLIANITSLPFALNWNSYGVLNGAHTATAKAFDASGNFATQSASFTVTNPPPPITGDINGDHKVNIFDLSLLLSRWRKSGSGDFNNNGIVDIFDLSVLLSRYGQDNSSY